MALMTTTRHRELSLHDHILSRPETYIGSIGRKKVQNLVWVNDRMVSKTISYVPGLYKIFEEILVNAAQHDPKMDSIRINIDVENTLITIFNNGDGISVVKHEGVYVPQMIFGHLFAETGGRTGVGAKLANIFSTEFTIETVDGKEKLKYKQIFYNNMWDRHEAVITQATSGEAGTTVSFKPDLEKFGMESLENDVVALMKKRVIDLACCLLGKGVKVELDGKRVPLARLEDYLNFYLPSETLRIYGNVHERWEICVSLADGHFEQVSFVNNIATIKGGTHVDYITNQIVKSLVEVVNKQNLHANIKADDVKNYLWVFVNALIDNPTFDSQPKEALTTDQSSFGSTCELTPEFLKEVAESEILTKVQAWVKFKQGGKDKIPIFEDARYAGTTKSADCTLILTEGNSAQALAVSGLSTKDRDYYGVFPLKGKLLNVRDASREKIKKNAVVQNIKKLLGLEDNKFYKDTKTLRYGQIMIMADRDPDGSHIKGLVINLLHCFWPSLLKLPRFVSDFITPIIKATHKESGLETTFDSLPEYKSWEKDLGRRAIIDHEIKYYKGLGTSTAEEGRGYFKKLVEKRKYLVWKDDVNDKGAIELAFSKNMREARREWLTYCSENNTYDSRKNNNDEIQVSDSRKINNDEIQVSDFINEDLMLYSRADNRRSIPNFMDGLKPVQRKILHSAFKKGIVRDITLPVFVGYVAKHTNYHHCERSLARAIIGMAQNFVGSNNVNLLHPSGQFGTRQSGGKDHADARYLNIKLSPITKYIFRKEDELLLDHLIEDGQSVEPTWFLPIIPLVLVNGCEGVGTGWSTTVPNYNPRDVIKNLVNLLNSVALVPMVPWYKGFKGTIYKKKFRKKEIHKKDENCVYVSTGDFEQKEEANIKITELPIKRWTQPYKEFLEKKVSDKDPFIEKYIARNDDTTVHFDVTIKNQMSNATKEELLKELHLISQFRTSNMHLCDAKGVIKNYESPEEILKAFFRFRLPIYHQRRRAITESLKRVENRLRFVDHVIGGYQLGNKSKKDILKELKRFGYASMPKESLDEHVEGAEETSEARKTIPGTDYDYLLTMEIESLANEQKAQLRAERDRMDKILENSTEPEAMWKADLLELLQQLNEQGY